MQFFNRNLAVHAKSSREIYDQILVNIEPSIRSGIFSSIDGATEGDTVAHFKIREDMKKIADEINARECKKMLDFWIHNLVPDTVPEKEKRGFKIKGLTKRH